MFKTNCDRCGISLSGVAWRVSYFNTDVCCPDCLKREQQHPDYQKAKEAELEAVRRGDYNFEGIGKPVDL